jgi:hypothetical protein
MCYSRQAQRVFEAWVATAKEATRRASLKAILNLKYTNGIFFIISYLLVLEAGFDEPLI